MEGTKMVGKVAQFDENSEPSGQREVSAPLGFFI